VVRGIWCRPIGYADHAFHGIFTEAEDPEGKVAANIARGVGVHPN
jgi:hypothetical protein